MYACSLRGGILTKPEFQFDLLLRVYARLHFRNSPILQENGLYCGPLFACVYDGYHPPLEAQGWEVAIISIPLFLMMKMYCGQMRDETQTLGLGD